MIEGGFELRPVEGTPDSFFFFFSPPDYELQ